MLHLNSELAYPVVSVAGDASESVVEALENVLCALDGESFVVVSLADCDRRTTEFLEARLRERTAAPNVVIATGYCRALAS